MSDVFSQPEKIFSVFNSLPGAFLLLSRELIIEAASDAYLEETLTERKDLIGRTMFQVFPDNPQTPEAKGVSNLRASLEQVLATGKPHQMAPQQYDVPDPKNPSLFLERHWLPLNTPVLDEQGQVQHIIHSAVNVTDSVKAEQKLRQSQAQEKMVQAAAKLQRLQLENILMQAPALICIFEGPQHIFKLVNPPYQQLVGERPLLGMPIAEAMPELIGQPIIGWLDEVYRTGESYHAHETLVQLDHHNAGNLGHNYYNFIYQATRNLAGEVDGILVFAYEVTAQVRARQQVQDLNEKFQAINEELQATNEELSTTNTQLLDAQLALQQLNETLEAQVTDRTRALQVALRGTEQQREQLRQQQGLLQQILGQVPAAIATLSGPDHQYTFFNDYYLALSGNRAKVGLRVADALPEVAEQGFVSFLHQVYTTGQPIKGVETPVLLYNVNTGQPTQRFLDFIYQPLVSTHGQIQGILAFIIDVTEKVKANQQAEALQVEVLAGARRLLQEREAFHQVFEQTPACIALLRGAEHRVAYCNPAYQALFPDRSLQDHRLGEVLPEVVEQGFIALLDKVYETGETFYGQEMQLTVSREGRTSPKTFYFNFTYQPYRENGEIIGVSIFAYEVTEQVLARQQRLIQQEQLRELFEQAPVAIAVFRGPEYVIEVANERVTALWGRTPVQVLGKTLFEALPEVRDQGFRELLDEVVRTGTAFVAREITALLQYEGELKKIYLDFVYQPLHDELGNITGVAAVATDVSEQVLARQQLAQANQELLISNTELDQANQQLTHTNVDLDNFIYTASHDLKTPILNIEGLMEALLEEIPAEVLQAPILQRTTNLILDSVQRFKRTIEHLTDITKLQKENSLAVLPINLAALIADVQLDLAPAIEATKAVVEVNVADGTVINFSERNLRSIIFNLFSNAIKYHSPERTPLVRVDCQVREEYLVLTVQDNGLGINLAQEDKLFAMFSRLHTHVEGSGIGLYMVKKIIENAGGKIGVQSKVGEGSSFCIYFKRNHS